MVAKEREQVIGGYAESTSLDGLNTVASVHQRQSQTVGPTAGGSRDEPMDIDAIQERIAQLEAMKKKWKDDDKGDNRKCFGCQQVGHIKRKCPNKDKWAKKEPGGGKKNQKDKDKGCIHCGKKGHTVENCFKRKADKAERKKRDKIQKLDETSGPAKDEEQSSDEDGEIGFLAEARGVVFH